MTQNSTIRKMTEKQVNSNLTGEMSKILTEGQAEAEGATIATD
jgi:hypothetical protein